MNRRYQQLLVLQKLHVKLHRSLDMLCDQPLQVVLTSLLPRTTVTLEQLRALSSSDSTADEASLEVNNHDDKSIRLTFKGALIHPQTRPLPHGECQWTRTVAASPFDVRFASSFCGFL
jgi:hypothetical protein